MRYSTLLGGIGRHGGDRHKEQREKRKRAAQGQDPQGNTRLVEARAAIATMRRRTDDGEPRLAG